MVGETVRIALINSELSDDGFALIVPKEVDRQFVKTLIAEGLSAWIQAANEEPYENDYFTQEEIESFYWVGWAEPAEMLLDRHKIPYEAEYTDDGEITDYDDLVEV